MPRIRLWSLQAGAWQASSDAVLELCGIVDLASGLLALFCAIQLGQLSGRGPDMGCTIVFSCAIAS